MLEFIVPSCYISRHLLFKRIIILHRKNCQLNLLSDVKQSNIEKYCGNAEKNSSRSFSTITELIKEWNFNHRLLLF